MFLKEDNDLMEKISMNFETLTCSKMLTLFRGDSLERFNELDTYGITSPTRCYRQTFNYEEYTWLKNSTPAALIIGTNDCLIKHVFDEKADSLFDENSSPFESFSGNKKAAEKWALKFAFENGDSLCLLSTVNIRITEEYVWETSCYGNGQGLFKDSNNRYWVYLPTYRFCNFVAPATLKKFYINCKRDDEYLMIGDLQPNDFTRDKILSAKKGFKAT